MWKRIPRYFTVVLLPLAMLPQDGRAQSLPETSAAGPDIILGNLSSLIQAGSDGTQVGLAIGTDICNNGNVQANWFRLPETDHPVIPQNLYRMSGGANNDGRFEQIGQSWVMHQYFPLQQNACGFGCTPSPDFAHLGVGCSTADTASINGSQVDLGSRAWVHPFTGAFLSTSNSHTGHTHDGTTHRILVEGNDLNTTMNQGATYYAEAQLITPHEYAWCQSHAGQCNMFNNVSYRQFMVTGTTSFNFAAVAPTVPMTPAIFAWPGATIQMIEPEPGVDGRAFLAYKVTQFGPWEWHYEYAIYNQNLDRGINFFSVPAGCGIGSAFNPAFHAPLNHPGIAEDGTAGNAGYSNTPWTIAIGDRRAFWFTETFAQNPNANALRWGTLYNFRFDGGPPTFGDATIAFFKTGAPVTVQVPGPVPECTPTIPPPSPTATTPPSATPSPTVIVDPPTPTATATATATPIPTPTPACGPLLGENFDKVIPPALPPGWSSTNWVTSTITPDSPPNCAFVDAPAFLSDRDLRSVRIRPLVALASISFRNNYNLESSGSEFFDGGVLEVSSPNINGGAFTDITDPTVGGSFLSGGYNGTISSNFGSPIAGRQAWSGNSGGYIDTAIYFGANVTGQTIELRFRMASDLGGSGTGEWRIDTIVFDGVCQILPGTPTPTPSATATPPPSPSPTPAPTPSPTPSPAAQALNLSTRMFVQTDDAVGIGGFIITGTDSKQLLLRAIGPSLTDAVQKPLADPVLELHGPGGFVTIINNNWRDAQEQEIQDTGIPPTNDLESAIVATLSPGGYTGIVRGNGHPVGVALIELYDLSPAADSALANISTRAFVQSGPHIVIAGFILGAGSGVDRVVVRGLGPSLSGAGVSNVLADPTLELRNGNGTLLIENDDWQDDPAQAVIITAAGLAPSDEFESAIAATLPPGSYTALLSGGDIGYGNGLVEVYDLGTP